MHFQNITDYKYSRLHYQRHDHNGFIISKPVDVKPLMQSLASVKAMEVEFAKTAFKKDFNAGGFLEELLTTPSLEFLGVERGHNMTKLPDAVAKQPLLYLECSGEYFEDFSNVLPRLTQLKQLRLNFKKAKLGSDIGKLKNLTMLRISADEISDPESLCLLENLEVLSLDIKQLPAIPEGFGRLKKLKHLEIRSANFNSLENLHFPVLTRLELYNLPALKGIPDSLLQSGTLEEISLYWLNQKSFYLPETLRLPSIRQLTIKGVGIYQLPTIYAPMLQKVRLEDLSVKSVCDKIKDASVLEEIFLSGLKLENDDINLLTGKKVKTYHGPVFSSSGIMNFTLWPDLHQLQLNTSLNGAFNISENAALQKVSLDNTAATVIDKLPANIEEVAISKCSQLTHITLTDTYPSLRYLYIRENLGLTDITLPGESFPKLAVLEITNCPKVKVLKPELLAAPELAHIRVLKDSLLVDDQIESVSDLLEFLHKNEVPTEEKTAIAFWLFRNYVHEVPSAQVLLSTLSLLRFANDLIFNLITKNIRYFNTNHKELSAFTPEEIKGAKVAIAGNTFATKTSIKESIKKLDANPVNDEQEASFVLVGKKVTTHIPFEEGKVLFSETELNQYLDTHQPKFLKQEQVTQSDLHNLRQILWSTNPETELMALEMLKNGGLPDEVIGECIAIAKTSIDKGVKDKYKSFLKGKVSEEAFKLVSKNVRFDLSDPFHKLQREFSMPLLGRLAMALYQRTKAFSVTTLNFHLNDFELRKQIIVDHVVPTVLERPHYLSLNFHLTEDELRYILLLPEIQGNLKRLHLTTYGDTLPDELGNHTTIKELIISGNLSSTNFPAVIFKLKRVSDLKISSDTIAEISEDIVLMKELKTLIVYNKKLVRLPEALRQLPKLKRAYFSGGIEDAQQWVEFLKTL